MKLLLILFFLLSLLAQPAEAAFVVADRVQETTTSVGLGTVNLLGPTTGYRTFVAGVGSGNTTYYAIALGTEWEVGLGTVIGGSPAMLSRDTVLASSNAGAKVNFSAGTKNVFVTMPSSRYPVAGSANTCSSVNADASHYLRGDCTWQTIPGGGDALTTSPLSQFALTTSAQLRAVLSDETGAGLAVFNNAPTFIAPVLGAASGTSLTLSTPLVVASGGLGVGTLAIHGVVIGNGTSPVSVIVPGAAGQVLTSNGTSSDPTFQAGTGGGISGLTSNTIPKATSSTTIGDSALLDCGSSVIGVGSCAGPSSGHLFLADTTMTAIAAPATPAAGLGIVYVDSTSKNLAVKDDAGVIKHGVTAKDCNALNAGDVVKSVSAAGVIGCHTSGTVSSGTVNRIPYYASTGTTVSGTATLTIDDTVGFLGIVTANAASQGSFGARLTADTFNRIVMGLDSGVPFVGWGPGTTARDTFFFRRAGDLSFEFGTSPVEKLRIGATGLVTMVAITAPATPAAGSAAVYVDSTSKKLCSKDDAGVVACTGAAGSGTVTSIATTAPITGGTITTTGTIACATCVTSAAALTSGQLVAGAGSQTSAVTNLTGDVTTSGTVATTIAANAVTSAKMAVVNTLRSCSMVIGADNGAALADADIGPQRKQCQVPYAATVVEVDVAADAGTPSVIVAKRHCTVGSCTTGANETVSNLVSAALAAGPGTTCSKTGATAGFDTFTTCAATLQNTGLLAGDWLELVSGTAGGTAKRVSVVVHYTAN